MPFGQPLFIIAVTVAVVIILALTAPIWMRLLNSFGKLISRQLRSGADVFDTIQNEEDKKENE